MSAARRRSAWPVFAAMAAGAGLGLGAPAWAQRLAPVGALYLALLKMCALPVIVTTVVTSFARLLRSGQSESILKRTALVFGGGMLAASAVGLALGAAFAGGIARRPDVTRALAALVAEPAGGARSAAPGLGAFVLGLVPENIFRSLSDGTMLPVMLFMTLLGLALGSKRGHASGFGVVEGFEELRDALLRMMDWFVAVLPFGILGLFAGTFARVSAGALWVLLGLIVVVALGSAAQMGAHLAWTCARTRRSPKSALAALKEPLLVAFGTSSSLAALPSTLEALDRGFKVEPWLAGLVAPLGTSFNAQASAYFCAFLGVFVCRLYAIPLGTGAVALLLAGSVLRAWSASGLPAAASIASMAIVFQPLGVPYESLAGVLLVLLPVLDPVLTAHNVSGNCASALEIARG